MVVTNLADVVELARELTVGIASLEVQVAARADQLAGPRIATAEAVYRMREITIEQAWAAERQRMRDLIDEMARQYATCERIRDRYQEQNMTLRARIAELESGERRA